MGRTLLIDKRDSVAVCTMNRPIVRNALNRELVRALRAAITELDEDRSVRVMVLTGADPAFCAGLDLKEWGSGAGPASLDYPEYFGALPPHDKPVIGAINGPAATGGLELALSCDFLLASERASFVDTHARVGVMPAWGLTVLLPLRVGLARAKEMSFTGGFIDAHTALAWGLVNRVVPHEKLLNTAMELAGMCAEVDPTALTQLRRTYDEVAGLQGTPAFATERAHSERWQETMFDSSALEARRAALLERARRLGAVGSTQDSGGDRPGS